MTKRMNCVRYASRTTPGSFSSRLPRLGLRDLLAPALLLAVVVGGANSASANSDSWNRQTSGNWSTGANWLSGTPPGSTNSTTSMDVATFCAVNTTNVNGTTVTVDTNRNIGAVNFNNTNKFLFTLSGGSLLLSDGAKIWCQQMVGGANQTIVSPITIEGDGGSATFCNDSTNTSAQLVINGTVQGVATAGNTTTLILNGTNNQANKIAGAVSDGTAGGKLAVVKNDSGYWRLSTSNTFSGGVTLNAGALRVEHNSALGANANPVTINGGSLTSYDGNARTLPQPVTVNGSFTLGLSGTGNLTLTGDMNLGGTNQQITVNNTNSTISGSISNGGLTKAGTGVLTFSGANTYTGATIIGGGVLSIPTIANGGNPSVLGASSSDPANLVLAGGTLSYSGPTANSDRGFTMSARTNTIDISSNGTTLTLAGLVAANTNYLQQTGAGNLTLDIGAGNTWSLGVLSANGGVVTFKSGTFIATSMDPSLAAGYNVGFGARTGKLVVDGATVYATNNGNTFKAGASTNGNVDILSGTVVTGDYVVGHNGNSIGTQSGGLIIATTVYHYNKGTGTNYLTGGTLVARRIYNNPANSIGDFTLVLNGGVLQVGAGAGTANLMDNSFSPLTSTNEMVVQLGRVGATIDTSLSSALIRRPLDDIPGQAGQLVKIGAGTLTLTTNNTYSGPTVVSNGVLVVNGSIGTGAVSVKSGATLGGSGTIGGAVSLEPGAMTLLSTWSALTIAGPLSLNSNVVHLNISSNTAAGSYTLATYNAAGSSGAFASTPVLDSGSFTNGTTGSIVTTNGTVSLEVAAIPVGPAAPERLTNSYSAGVLSLSWPAGEGWRLQMQTNALSVGLSTNWVYLTDGSVSSTNITADPTKPTVFFRLMYP